MKLLIIVGILGWILGVATVLGVVSLSAWVLGLVDDDPPKPDDPYAYEFWDEGADS